MGIAPGLSQAQFAESRGPCDSNGLDSPPTEQTWGVPHLSPTTLTTDEQRLILQATAGNVRDHTIISLALGTGLGLPEPVGIDPGCFHIRWQCTHRTLRNYPLPVSDHPMLPKQDSILISIDESD